MLFHALVMSTFTKTSAWHRFDGVVLENFRAACTSASQPPDVPTPNCAGRRLSNNKALPCLAANLAASLRYVQPTAMVRTAPSFLVRAHNDAP